MVYSAQNKLSEALTHFQTALAMNSRSKDAKAGLARLEKLMKVRLTEQFVAGCVKGSGDGGSRV
jgi:hypothetical protein